MAERPSGYYYVRYRDRAPEIAEWNRRLYQEFWFLNGEFYGEGRITVLFGPIPGPEELEAMFTPPCSCCRERGPGGCSDGCACNVAIAQAAPEREKP